MSPRSPEQLEQIRLESRMKILEAALELFAKQGFHNTSIEQIRKKAGVSKGLIYNYFSSKEDLMNQIFFNELEKGQEMLDEIRKKETPEEMFRFLIEFSFKYAVEQRDHSKLTVALALQMDDFPQLKEMIMGRFQGILPLFSQLMEELGVANPTEEAIAIGAMMDGIGLQSIVLGDAFPLEKMKQYILDKYLPQRTKKNS